MSSGEAKRNQFNAAWVDSDVQRLRILVENAERSNGGKLKRGEGSRITALFPDRSRHSVEHQISLLGQSGQWEKKKYLHWTEDEELLLRSLYSGEKWRLEIEKRFPGRNRQSVLEKARQLGLSRRILRTEPKLLTGEQAALMAGLLMGDGCLSHRISGYRNGQHINSIEFSNTDVGLVELFASMVTNCNVRSYQPKMNKLMQQRKVHYAAGVYARETVKNLLEQILRFLAGEKLTQAKEMLICLRGGH